MIYTVNKNIDPWERQLCDDEDSWLAFVAYRDSKPPRRIMRTRGMYPQAQVSKWYNDHAWVERVAAYDTYLDTIRRAEREDVFKQHERAIASEHALLLKDAREFVTREVQKYLEASQASDGVGLIRPSDLIKLMENVVKLDRLAMGQATERTETTAMDLTKLTPTELKELAALQKKISVEVK